MAETPLFLSIMALVYRDTESKHILVSENLDIQHKHLFDTYIARMFERPERSNIEMFKQKDVLHWLSWLAKEMIEQNAVPYLLENMQTRWLNQKKQGIHRWILGLFVGLSYGLIFGLIFKLLIVGLIGGLLCGLIFVLSRHPRDIEMVDTLIWKKQLRVVLISGLIIGLIFGLMTGLTMGLISGLIAGLSMGLVSGLILGSGFRLGNKPINQTAYPGQRISFLIRNFFLIFLFVFLILGLTLGRMNYGLIGGLSYGVGLGLLFGMIYVGLSILRHYTLRLIISSNNLLPWRLVPFLDYCADRIFLRRVGGGYIFVHRLLMEHFAAMYSKSDKAG
jgi:hypothetical protein